MQEVHKELRNKGEAYFSMKKVNNELQLVARKSRKLKPRCPGSGCAKSQKRRCAEISDSQREELFDSFWKNLDKEQKKLFICENVLEHKVERRRALKGYKKLKKLNPEYEPSENSRRESTFQYFLPIGKERYQVCQKMFLNTLAVTSNYVHCWRKCNYKLFKNRVPDDLPKEVVKAKDELTSSEDDEGLYDDKDSIQNDGVMSEDEVIVPRTSFRRTKIIKEECDD